MFWVAEGVAHAGVFRGVMAGGGGRVLATDEHRCTPMGRDAPGPEGLEATEGCGYGTGKDWALSMRGARDRLRG